MSNLLSLVETRVGNPERNRHYSCLEYSGPCPWCGGNDRFHVYPDLGPLGRYHCLGSQQGRAGCGRKGDSITYLMERTGTTFVDACKQLGLTPSDVYTARQAWREEGATGSNGNGNGITYELPSPCINASWSTTALSFVRSCESLLPEFPIVMEYLLQERGLTEDMIHDAHLGYYPFYKFVKAETWGLEQGKKVLLVAGITIPWIDGDGNVIGIRVRRLPGDESLDARTYYGIEPDGMTMRRYRALRGSSTDTLYREGLLSPGGQVALFEGEFDALIACRTPGVVTIATGSTAGGKSTRSLSLLASQEQVLVCFDTDTNGAGEKAADWWLARLRNAKRWRPLWKDANAMSMGGADIGAWITLGFDDGHAAGQQREETEEDEQSLLEEEEEQDTSFHCALCEQEVEYYLEEGTPLCNQHYQMVEGAPVISYEPTEQEQTVIDLLRGGYKMKLLYSCQQCGCRLVWWCLSAWVCVRCTPGTLWSEEVRVRIAEL